MVLFLGYRLQVIYELSLFNSVTKAFAAVAGTTPFPRSRSLSTRLEDPLVARPSSD